MPACIKWLKQRGGAFRPGNVQNRRRFPVCLRPIRDKLIVTQHEEEIGVGDKETIHLNQAAITSYCSFEAEVVTEPIDERDDILSWNISDEKGHFGGYVIVAELPKTNLIYNLNNKNYRQFQERFA